MLLLKGRVYNITKQLALVFLPALATLYFGLAQVWGWDHGSEVVATITAIDTFLGVILGISAASYNSSANDINRLAGAIVVTPETENDPMRATLELNDDHSNLKNGDELTFKVTGP